ncbi:MAG: hypothetical protein KIPDCIKN_02547 [Haliscomenobacter sp.]|jgi:hypothetical protein|nr:hypothetical protein [Haliscomenobacter sp.]
MFFNRNAIWMGILVGLALPFAGYGVLLMLAERVETVLFQGKELAEPVFDGITLQVLALCLNLIPLHLYNKRRYALSMRGVLIATSLYALAWVFLFGSNVLRPE